jgi:hypothetical protein
MLRTMSLMICLVLAGLQWDARAADTAVSLPPPASDARKPTGPLQTAVLAGGCFWGVQGVFEHVKGVRRVLSGYAGGAQSTAQYESVSTGTTGHAESVQIVYDPRQVSYGEILRVFLSVGHLLCERRAARDRTGLHRPIERGKGVREADRDAPGSVAGLLSGGSLPPGFPDQQSPSPVHRVQ